MSNCTALTELNCQHNRFTKEGLNALFGTLHVNTSSKTINIYANPDADDCDQSIATAKGWEVDATE